MSASPCYERAATSNSTTSNNFTIDTHRRYNRINSIHLLSPCFRAHRANFRARENLMLTSYMWSDSCTLGALINERA